MLFGLVASGLWIVTTFYSIGYMRGHHEQHQTRFYICFAIAISGALGVAFAANVFTLFVFYELITLSTFPLVTHAGTTGGAERGPDVSRHPHGDLHRLSALRDGVDLAGHGHHRLHDPAASSPARSRAPS